jgi:uncharacterized protein (TIGR03083 family)
LAWTHDAYCDALEAEITRFADVVRGADLDTAVPTCGDWTLANLVEHTGIVERWAAEMVRRRATERLDRRRLDVPVPDHADELPEWLAAGSDEIVGAFRATDPDAAMWAWGAEKHARFWPRRMLHETTVHRADAELALGRDPRIDADVAVDGVDELLDNLPHAAYFRPHVAELRGDGESLHVHCTDADGEWTVRLEPDGFHWDHGHAKATTAVRGPAGDLLLLIYRRRPPTDDRYEVYGDDRVLARWLEHSALGSSRRAAPLGLGPGGARRYSRLPERLGRARSRRAAANHVDRGGDVGAPGRVHRDRAGSATGPHPRSDDVAIEHQRRPRARPVGGLFTRRPERTVRDAHTRDVEHRAEVEREAGPAGMVTAGRVGQEHVGR